MRYVFIMLACLAGTASANDLTIPADREIIRFDAGPGVVTFLHRMHAELSITECSTCHHTLKPGDETVTPCHDCHGSKDGEAPEVKTAFHWTCTGCHEYTVAHGNEAGPAENRCTLCHIVETAE